MNDISQNIINNQNLNNESQIIDENKSGIYEIDIRLIKPNKNQPRKNFDMNLLNELSESIKMYGILQPIILREKDENGYYEIIAGERRWRASLMSNLEKIPAIIKNYELDNDAFLISVIENLQRLDLSPIEELNSYIRLYDQGYTHEEIGNLVNKSRSYITNFLRLSELSDEIKDMIDKKKISIGHAKLLLNQEHPEILANDIILRDLSVRQTEELVRKNINKGLIKNEKNQNNEYFERKDINAKNQEIIELEELISKSLNSEIFIENNYIKINYTDFEDLDRIINILISNKINLV